MARHTSSSLSQATARPSQRRWLPGGKKPIEADSFAKQKPVVDQNKTLAIAIEEALPILEAKVSATSTDVDHAQEAIRKERKDARGKEVSASSYAVAVGRHGTNNADLTTSGQTGEAAPVNPLLLKRRSMARRSPLIPTCR